MVELGQTVMEALGGQCELASSNPGDLRSAEIANGVAEATGGAIGIQMPDAGADGGIHAGFNSGAVGLDTAGGTAYAAGTKPAFDADQTAPDRTSTATFGLE